MSALSMTDRLRLLGAAILVMFPLAGGLLVLWQDGWAINRLNVWVLITLLGPFGLHRHITPEQFAAVMNVALFVPVGFALYLIWHRWWWALVVLGISLSIEGYQFMIGTRIASVLDVLTNTAGGIIGILLAWWLLRRAAGRDAAAPAVGNGGADISRGGADLAEPSPAADAPRGAADQTIPSAPHERSAHAPAAARGGHD